MDDSTTWVTNFDSAKNFEDPYSKNRRSNKNRNNQKNNSNNNNNNNKRGSNRGGSNNDSNKNEEWDESDRVYIYSFVRPFIFIGAILGVFPLPKFYRREGPDGFKYVYHFFVPGI